MCIIMAFFLAQNMFYVALNHVNHTKLEVLRVRVWVWMSATARDDWASLFSVCIDEAVLSLSEFFLREIANSGTPVWDHHRKSKRLIDLRWFRMCLGVSIFCNYKYYTLLNIIIFVIYIYIFNTYKNTYIEYILLYILFFVQWCAKLCKIVQICP